jgi:hypothetical protein
MLRLLLSVDDYKRRVWIRCARCNKWEHSDRVDFEPDNLYVMRVVLMKDKQLKSIKDNKY